MKNIWIGILIFLFSFGAFAQAGGPAIKGADLSWSHPNFQANLELIWNFSNQTLAGLNADTVAPVIFIEPFDRASQSAELTRLQNDWIVQNPGVWSEWTLVDGASRSQLTPEWTMVHLKDLYPFPKTFRGFHYDGTNIIQVNPETTFMAFFQNDPYGRKSDMVGYGYYVSGHEMTHHSLAQRGIPETLHHCIFITEAATSPSLMQRLETFLVENGMAGPMVTRYGLRGEVLLDPCGSLSPADQLRAGAYALALAPKE